MDGGGGGGGAPGGPPSGGGGIIWFEIGFGKDCGMVCPVVMCDKGGGGGGWSIGGGKLGAGNVSFSIGAGGRGKLLGCCEGRLGVFEVVDVIEIFPESLCCFEIFSGTCLLLI